MTQEEQRGLGNSWTRGLACLYPAATVQDRQGQGESVHQGDCIGWTIALGNREGLEGVKSQE